MHQEKANIMVIAHRGGAGLAFENTIEAFINGEKLGADAIECDVHLTKDMKLVVIHDPDLKRIAGVDEKISELNLNEIKKIKIGEDGFIPTLQEVLDSTTITLIIELKSRNTTNEISKLLQRNSKLLKRVAIISFDHWVILKLKKEFPDLTTALLMTDIPASPEIAANSCLTDTISLYYKGIDKNYVDLCHNKGIRINVWTVNGEKEIKEMIEAGVDAIASDRPDLVLKELGRK